MVIDEVLLNSYRRGFQKRHLRMARFASVASRMARLNNIYDTVIKKVLLNGCRRGSQTSSPK